MKLKGLLKTGGQNKIVYLLSSGILFTLVAAFMGYSGFPYIIGQQIKSKVALNNGSDSMKAFKNLPAPMEFRVYVFNVTNPEEVNRGERPVLQEVGPYVYDEHRKKENIKYSTGDTLLYRTVKTYYFNQEKSGCNKESDIVTTVNIPLLGTGYMVEEKFPVGLTFLNAALPFLFPNASTPFLTVPVGDLLFYGVRISCDYETGPAMPVCRAVKSKRPPALMEVPGTKDFAFSMFHSVNSTPGGLFKIYRGNTDIYNLGKIIEYNNLTYLDTWDKNTTCSLLKGTDSSIMSPINNPKDDLYLYLSDVCLSLRATFKEETEMYGIHVYSYESAKENFASSNEVEENACRCRKVEDKPPKCLKKGAIDATNCQGSPVIFTPPHFLHSDEEYKSYPIGLKPNKSKHETQVSIEPRTGVPLAAFKRIQMNIFLRKLDGIDLLANVSEGLFPLVWVEEALPEEIVNTYLPSLRELKIAINTMFIVMWVVIAVGILSIIASGTLYMKHNRMSCFRENQVLSNISLVGARNPVAKDDEDKKRTVFSIPTAQVGADNSLNSNSNSFYPESMSKRTNNSLPR